MLQGPAGCAKTTFDPLFKVFSVRDFVEVILHHVHMASLNEYLFPLSHRLEQLLIILLLLDDLLLRVQILPLVTHLLLHYVFRPQLPQFLLEHEFVVLVAHELFDLLLTPLQLHHNLSVSLLDRLTVIALARATEFEGLVPLLLGILLNVQLLLVEDLHDIHSLRLALRSILYILLHHQVLMRAEHGNPFVQRLVFLTQSCLAHRQTLSVALTALRELGLVMLKLFVDALGLLRLETPLVLLYSLLLLPLVFKELLDAAHPLLLNFFQLFLSILFLN